MTITTGYVRGLRRNLQVTNVSDKFSLDEKGKPLDTQKLAKKQDDIQHDIRASHRHSEFSIKSLLKQPFNGV